ncbi:MAG: hypothetical protein Q9187_005201 [Circinaria calcarea]
MATASKIHLSIKDVGVFHVKGITEESAAKASEVLQQNHEKHHIFFNQEGFHNHIAHHVLTLYALGASPATIQRHYDNNKSYQRHAETLIDGVAEDLHDPANFQECLGNERYYHDYLVFFQNEIDKKGVEEVINDYLLKGNERAEDLLVRTYSGFLHPLIHLGFGVEFKQPAIVAEALAQAAVHDNWLTPFFKGAEQVARAGGKTNDAHSLVDLLDQVRADRKLSSAARWDDGNKIRDGILARASDEMINYASQWNVSIDELQPRTAEMTNAAAYFTGGAQHPPKQIKFDFYYMHCVNASIFYSSFLNQHWISDANKARLLEWKGRLDLCMYASRRSPQPLLEEIVNYRPKEALSSSGSWEKIFDRVKEHEDDGHASKFIRALAHGKEICEPYEESGRFRIKQAMWSQLANMVIDSVEDTGDTWVRSAGFDEAWTKWVTARLRSLQPTNMTISLGMRTARERSYETSCFQSSRRIEKHIRNVDFQRLEMVGATAYRYDVYLVT